MNGCEHPNHPYGCTTLTLDLDTVDVAPAAAPVVASTGSMVKPITDKQRSFIETLIAERDLTGTPYDNWLPKWENATSKMASAVIDYLTTLPKREPTRTERPVHEGTKTGPVPAGRYAIVLYGETKFYKVDCPTEGKWAGYTFVKVLASDTEHPIRNSGLKSVILAQIAEDPAAASARYGHEIGECGVCGRTLTDEVSRARGIGPICADKRGW